MGEILETSDLFFGVLREFTAIGFSAGLTLIGSRLLSPGSARNAVPRRFQAKLSVSEENFVFMTVFFVLRKSSVASFCAPDILVYCSLMVDNLALGVCSAKVLIVVAEDGEEQKQAS